MSGDERSTRQQILDAVRRYPGIHVRETARQVGTSVALVEYHVPFLQDQGLLTVEADGSYNRLYATDADAPAPKHRPWLAILRQPFPLQVVTVLLDRDDAMRHAELVEATGMGKSKLSFHLRKLEKAGVVTKEDGRFHLADRTTTETLLLRHRPTQDLTDRFADFWAAFYDR